MREDRCVPGPDVVAGRGVVARRWEASEGGGLAKMVRLVTRAGPVAVAGLMALWIGLAPVEPAGLARAAPRASGKPFVKMAVQRVGQAGQQYFVLLETQGKGRLLPIIIGLREAQAIDLGLRQVTPPRPLTHNLLESAIRALGSLHRVEIVAMRSKVFIGRLWVKDARGRTHKIDARPSDLIALAVTAHEPIWVSAVVLKKAGIAPPKKGKSP